MRTRLLPLLLVPAVMAGACSSGNTTRPQRTALEIREMQTREYQTTDVKMVMKSLLNVLQDEGFIVRNANVDLGLITAEKQVETSSDNNLRSGTTDVVLGVMAVALSVAFPENNISYNGSSATEESRWEKYRSIECSANVSEFGDRTRVRVNFQERAVDNRGDVVTVHQIDDIQFYQTFFAKVDKGIFIAKEKL